MLIYLLLVSQISLKAVGQIVKLEEVKNLKKDKDIIIKLYPHMINFRKK